MKTLRIVVAASLVLAATAASAASRGGPPLIDLTAPCCQSDAHKAQHDKAYQLAMRAPPSERGKVLSDNWCNPAKSKPYKNLAETASR